MVRSLDGNWQICETAFITAPDVFRWNIVTSRQDPISDSRQIDLHIFRANVDQHDLEPSPPRVQHHPQVILPRQRGFNGEAFSLRQMFARRLQNLTCTSNRKMLPKQQIGESYQSYRDRAPESPGTTRNSSGSKLSCQNRLLQRQR